MDTRLRLSDGCELQCRIVDYTDPWRNAPYLILQHGFGRSGRFWYSWVPYLARFYKVVRPDMRGLGQSSADFDLATAFTLAWIQCTSPANPWAASSAWCSPRRIRRRCAR